MKGNDNAVGATSGQFSPSHFADPVDPELTSSEFPQDHRTARVHVARRPPLGKLLICLIGLAVLVLYLRGGLFPSSPQGNGLRSANPTPLSSIAPVKLYLEPTNISEKDMSELAHFFRLRATNSSDREERIRSSREHDIKLVNRLVNRFAPLRWDRDPEDMWSEYLEGKRLQNNMSVLEFATRRLEEAVERRRLDAGTYTRVSKCILDASLICMKLGSAILNIEAVATGGMCSMEAQGYAVGRRLDAIASGSFIPHDKYSHEESSRMSCSANLNGMVSGLTAVSQYVSGSIVDCPPLLDHYTKETALCSLGVSVTLSGLTKMSAALSDIIKQCQYVQETLDTTGGKLPPYDVTTPIKEDRKQQTRAACLFNVGQATVYLAKVGFAFAGSGFTAGTDEDGYFLNVCQQGPHFDQYSCLNQMGAQLANIGQVATYISGAVSDCGDEILINAGCANRIAATITGAADVAQGAGQMAQACASDVYS